MKISARDLDAIMRKSVGTRELDEDEKVVQSYTAPLKDFKPVSAKKIASRPKSFVKTKSGKYTPAKSAPMRSPEAATSSPRRSIAKGISPSREALKTTKKAPYKNTKLVSTRGGGPEPKISEIPSPVRVSKRNPSKARVRGGAVTKVPADDIESKLSSITDSASKKVKEVGDVYSSIGRSAARMAKNPSQTAKRAGKALKDVGQDYRFAGKEAKRALRGVGDQYEYGYRKLKNIGRSFLSGFKDTKKSFTDINEFNINQVRNSDLNKSINEVRKYAAMISDNKMNLKDALDKLPNNMRDDLFSELRKIRGSKK